MKKSIIKNHMSHKGRVTTLQAQFTNQKYATKHVLMKEITKMKTDLTQVNKHTQQQKNCCLTLFDARQELEQQLKKRQEKTKGIKRESHAIAT